MSCRIIPASCPFHSSYPKALLGILLIGLSLMLVSCDAGLRAGKYPDAEPYFQQTLQQHEQDFDPKHPDIETSLNNLAGLSQTQGKDADAEPCFQRALRIDEAALGPDHPDVARDLNNLAPLYYAQGKYAEAEPLYQKSYWIFLRKLGPNHPNVEAVFGNYQRFLQTSGQSYDEETVIRKLREAQPVINVQSSSTSPSRPSYSIRIYVG